MTFVLQTKATLLKLWKRAKIIGNICGSFTVYSTNWSLLLVVTVDFGLFSSKCVQKSLISTFSKVKMTFRDQKKGNKLGKRLHNLPNRTPDGVCCLFCASGLLIRVGPEFWPIFSMMSTQHKVRRKTDFQTLQKVKTLGAERLGYALREDPIRPPKSWYPESQYFEDYFCFLDVSWKQRSTCFPPSDSFPKTAVLVTAGTRQT